MEEFLCHEGFSAEYLALFAEKQRRALAAPLGTPASFAEIAEAVRKTDKITGVRSVCEAIRSDPRRLPTTLRRVVDICVRRGL